MAEASPVTSKYFLIKWVYIVTIPNGRRVKNFSVSKLFCDFAFEEKIGLNDYEDSYLCNQDGAFFVEFIKQKYNLYCKVIDDPRPCKNEEEGTVQCGFLCIEARNSEQFELIKEKLECQNIYGYRVLNVFPWLSSIYYEDMVTYQDK